nr:hypothetical protein CFP56_42224 [Quercus suber]
MLNPRVSRFPQIKVHGHDVRVEIAVKHGGFTTFRRLLRGVHGGEIPPFFLFQRVRAHLPAAQEGRVQVLVIPREPVQHQRVDRVRLLIRQRHPRDRRDAVPDVRDFLVRDRADASGFQKSDHQVHLLHEHLRLHFEQPVRSARVAAADQVEGDGRVAFGVHAPRPAVFLGLVGEIPHDFAKGRAVHEHLDRVAGFLVVVSGRRAVDGRDVVGGGAEVAEIHKVVQDPDVVVVPVVVVVLAAVLRHVQRDHHLRAFIARVVLERADMLRAGRNERQRALEWVLQLRASDGCRRSSSNKDAQDHVGKRLARVCAYDGHTRWLERGLFDKYITPSPSKAVRLMIIGKAT